MNRINTIKLDIDKNKTKSYDKSFDNISLSIQFKFQFKRYLFYSFCVFLFPKNSSNP